MFAVSKSNIFLIWRDQKRGGFHLIPKSLIPGHLIPDVCYQIYDYSDIWFYLGSDIWFQNHLIPKPYWTPDSKTCDEGHVIPRHLIPMQIRTPDSKTPNSKTGVSYPKSGHLIPRRVIPKSIPDTWFRTCDYKTHNSLTNSGHLIPRLVIPKPIPDIWFQDLWFQNPGHLIPDISFTCWIW